MKSSGINERSNSNWAAVAGNPVSPRKLPSLPQAEGLSSSVFRPPRSRSHSQIIFPRMLFGVGHLGWFFRRYKIASSFPKRMIPWSIAFSFMWMVTVALSAFSSLFNRFVLRLYEGSSSKFATVWGVTPNIPASFGRDRFRSFRIRFISSPNLVAIRPNIIWPCGCQALFQE